MKEITVTLKSEIDFSNAQVGDDVFCIVFGIGKIAQIDDNDFYPVKVNFMHGEEEYTKKGSLYKDNCRHASLYYFNPETQEVLYSRPEPKIDWTEYEGKLIEVNRFDNGEWFVRKLWKYAPQFTTPFLCHDTEVDMLTIWKHARLIKEDSCRYIKPVITTSTVL